MAGARVQALGGDDPATLGPYRLIGRLASGGMGRIYLARSGERGGRGLVAVKTLLAEGPVSDVDRRRFAREVSLAQRVASAYTARVREADPDAERPWMAIDYIAAPPLSELVRNCGVLPASAVRWIAAGTAEALVTLHGVGIVHRDVKPQNVLLPLDGPRVIDFGISHASDLTLTGLTLGTIAFTSPEQARGEESTAASDVYSLGATLFLLATGRPPYRADGDTLRLLARVQRGELDLGGLPKELVATIRPCLSVDPARRPEPAELLARFRRDQAGLPASQSGTRWLPPRWTALIGAYATQGLELANDRPTSRTRPPTANPVAPTLVQRTPVAAPPPPTLVYPPERRARAARDRARRDRTRQELAALSALAQRQRAEQDEQERTERERADAARLEAERQADRRQEAERARRERERAAQESERAERERAQRRAERERVQRELAERERAAREAADRASREQAEREARRRAEREQARRAARAAQARTSSPSTAPPAPGPTRPTPPRTGASGLGWLVAVAAVIALLVWQPWETGGNEASSGGSSSSDSSSGAVSAGSGLDTHTDDSGTGTGSGTGSSVGAADDSDDESVDEPTPTPTPTPTPSPTPDATDRAFAAVRAGDCLNVYNDGHNDMSADRPVRVSCGASNAYMHVNRVSTLSGGSGSCDTGAGFTWWSRSGDDGVDRTLCLDRVFQVGQCFPADVTGATSADLTVVWRCNASTVPVAGQSILRITGFYRAPAAGQNWTCPSGHGERFWYWPVNQGRSIICASAA
ncbi:serine/threonine-protein kinase [Streptomyces sp. NBC_01013]|uniref:serine/threonine-protein kinase n=1 Tax=Streptomyces sp. NBC_01013 TaxID=2903718 RepID=UPI003865F9AA|nr:serine/threonine protein kinase [Streptomyces sp. NBC_01013]